MDINHYTTLKDNPGQGSCADLDQTLAINAIMATTILGIVQNMYYQKPMTYSEVSISLTGANRTTYLTADNLAYRVLNSRSTETNPLLEASSWPKGYATGVFENYLKQQRKELIKNE